MPSTHPPSGLTWRDSSACSADRPYRRRGGYPLPDGRTEIRIDADSLSTVVTAHRLTAPIRDFAAALPEAWEDHPWGEAAFKVGKKVFVFLGGLEDRGLVTVKLRDSHDEAMAFDWVEPTRYGLDRGGWVTCAVPEDAPLDMITAWIAESYRLVAPKRLLPLGTASGDAPDSDATP